MLNQQIITSLAQNLNDRYGQHRFAALSALTKLILRRARGDRHVSSNELNALLHTQLEEGFPLPYLQMHIDAQNNTVTLNNFEFKVPEEEAEVILDWNHHALWRVAARNEAGEYEVVACSDPYAIPHGQLSAPLDVHYGRTAPSAVVVENMVMVNGGITWMIDTVEQAARIISQRGLALPYHFQRTFNHVQTPANLILDESIDLSQTFVDGDVAADLGLEYPEQGMVSVLDLINELIEVKAANPASAPEDEEAVKVATKIQQALNFKAILADVLALPAKKRTTKAIGDAIAKHLPPQ